MILTSDVVNFNFDKTKKGSTFKNPQLGALFREDSQTSSLSQGRKFNSKLSLEIPRSTN
jgi:hypothetical protein